MGEWGVKSRKVDGFNYFGQRRINCSVWLWRGELGTVVRIPGRPDLGLGIRNDL